MAQPPASSVALCGAAPVFVNVTTVADLGRDRGRVELEVLDRDRDRPGVLRLAARRPAAADVAADGATADGAAAGAAGDDPLDEQAASDERQAGDEGAE